MRTHGNGAMTVVNPASSAVAPTVPSLWYIWPANNGNAAANVVRTKVFPAIALAATGRYDGEKTGISRVIKGIRL